jgi:glutaredoxin
MKLATSCLGLALLLCAAGAGAQVYKWVDAQGKTHISDRPPPVAQAAPIAAAPANPATDLPYALSLAVRNAPVVLYTTSPCTPCDQGRSLLRGRGIPFSEKTVNSTADIDKLKQVSPEGQLPSLSVGSKTAMGYESIAWGKLLDYAGYPSSRMLPPGYQYPAAVAAAGPAAAAPATVAAAAPAPARRPAPPPPKKDPDEPKFQF